MANTSRATVIVLKSHPVWVAAQRRARQRSEAMRRHPSFVAREHAAASGGEVAAAAVRHLRVCPSADEPA